MQSTDNTRVSDDTDATDAHAVKERAKCTSHTLTQRNTPCPKGNDTRQVEKGLEAVSLAPDGGWGWIVVLAASVINCINVGIISSQGLFYPFIQDKFQVSLTSVSWIGSIYNGMGSIGGLVNPMIIQRLGCRRTGVIGATLLCSGFLSSMFVNNFYFFYVTASLIPGIGHSMQFLSLTTIVGKYFHRKRPLAYGLVMCGGAVGTIAFPPLMTYLLATFTLWDTFWLLGGILLNEYWSVLSFGPVTEAKEHGHASSSGIPIQEYLKLLKTPKMILLLVSGLLQGLVYFIFPAFIPTISRRQIDGLTLEQAASVLSVAGILSMFGRVLSGGVSTILHQYILHFYIVSLAGCGVMTAMVTIISSYPMLLVVSGMYGVFQGGMWTLQPSVVHDLFGQKKFTHAFGLLLLANGATSLVGSPFASYLTDQTGDDMTLFYLCTSGFLLSALSLVPLTVIYKCSGLGDVSTIAGASNSHIQV